jgi:hypothetical protein
MIVVSLRRVFRPCARCLLIYVSFRIVSYRIVSDRSMVPYLCIISYLIYVSFRIVSYQIYVSFRHVSYQMYRFVSYRIRSMYRFVSDPCYLLTTRAKGRLTPGIASGSYLTIKQHGQMGGLRQAMHQEVKLFMSTLVLFTYLLAIYPIYPI